MQVIVIGCGKVGSKLASVLSKEGHDVVIVDSDRNSFKNLGSDFNGITITGIPIDQDVLKRAGIETADALAAVTPDDNINIMTCQVAKEIFKVPKVIARIYNPEREHVFHQFGLDTICPTNLTVEAMCSMLQGEKEVKSHVIANNRIWFGNQSVSGEEIGMRVGDLVIDKSIMVFGIIRNSELILANPDIRIEKNDELVIARKAM